MDHSEKVGWVMKREAKVIFIEGNRRERLFFCLEESPSPRRYPTRLKNCLRDFRTIYERNSAHASKELIRRNRVSRAGGADGSRFSPKNSSSSAPTTCRSVEWPERSYAAVEIENGRELLLSAQRARDILSQISPGLVSGRVCHDFHQYMTHAERLTRQIVYVHLFLWMTGKMKKQRLVCRSFP